MLNCPALSGLAELVKRSVVPFAYMSLSVVILPLF